jgi:hypothetical protein
MRRSQAEPIKIGGGVVRVKDELEISFGCTRRHADAIALRALLGVRKGCSLLLKRLFTGRFFRKPSAKPPDPTLAGLFCRASTVTFNVLRRNHPQEATSLSSA